MDIPILFFAYVLFWGPIYVCRFYVSLSVHAHALESVRGSSLVAKAADGLADVFVSAGPLVAARKKTCCCCCRQKPGLLRSYVGLGCGTFRRGSLFVQFRAVRGLLGRGLEMRRVRRPSVCPKPGMQAHPSSLTPKSETLNPKFLNP